MTKFVENTNGAFNIIFFGDNGQGDLLAAIEMLKHRLIHYAFIRITTSKPQIK